jgi:chromatin structure-remodeling complex subunit RSC9
MWEHIIADHLGEKRNEEGQFDNVEKEFTCTWDQCSRLHTPTKMHLQNFARHINTHISLALPNEAHSQRPERSWVVPAKTMTVTYEETATVRDERNPNLPPQAAGIPLSAALVLRNIARNVVKTEAEEEMLKKQKKLGETGGWNETLFRPLLPRFFEILAQNRALVCFPLSLTLFSKVNLHADQLRRVPTLHHCLI